MDVIKIWKDLKTKYKLYLQTGVPISNNEISKERIDVVDKMNLWKSPIIEFIPKYKETGDIYNVCKEIGISNNFASFVDKTNLFSNNGKNFNLYTHQRDSLKNAVNGNHVITTTGTGSGKTESFLLPMLYNILKSKNEYTKDQCVKSIIIYPLNALVEDQLVRLRKALNSDLIKKWYTENSILSPITFGRYTSRTPKNRNEDNSNKKGMNYTWGKIKHTSREGEEFFYCNTDDNSTELWDRDSMHKFPPDILITNYTMLNVLLMREKGRAFFDKTKKWLEDRNNVFTLVIDELHSYRGTAGAEVVYSIKLFLSQLGLNANHPQLRIVGTSASFEDEENTNKYLADFFSLSVDEVKQKVRLIKGDRPEILNAQIKPIDPFVLSSQLDIDDDYLNRYDIAARLANKLYDTSKNKFIAKPIESIEKELFNTEGISNTEKLLKLISEQININGNRLIKLRVHLFFRIMEALWACSNPYCGEGNDRPFGKLYHYPRYKCEDCGSIVLQVAVCRNCGQVYLSGYKYKNDKHLTPTLVMGKELDATVTIYDKFDFEPNQLPKHEGTKWEFAHYDYTTAKFEPSGQIKQLANCIISKNSIDADYPNFPDICPACGHKDKRFKPITSHKTGVQKVPQILATGLARHSTPLVAFSDSRQGCAKLSAGIEESHYKDLLRQQLCQSFKSMCKVSQECAKLINQLKDKPHNFRDIIKNIQELNNIGQVDLLYDLFYDENNSDAYNKAITVYSAKISPLTLRKNIEDNLNTLGVNPVGPYPSKEKYWRTKFEGEDSKRAEFENFMIKEMLDILFSQRTMSFEALGLGIVRYTADEKYPPHIRSFLASAIRIYGEKGRWARTHNVQQSNLLKNYIDKIVEHKKASEQELIKSFEEIRKSILNDNDALTGQNLVITPISEDGYCWICKKCHTRHYHDSLYICTHCYNELEKKPIDTSQNYYVHLLDENPIRLRCEELSGQTSTDDSLSRQRRFQNIYEASEDGEYKKTYGIDLLSVTTTMEAGVDIGALSAVLLGGVPPKRFNYQQRVGRVGRRNMPLSIALTIAGGNNHDLTNFNEPERMVSYPIPDPYLEMNRFSIVKRVVAKEVLRRAFTRLKLSDNNAAIHGNFGLVDAWKNNKQSVSDAIYNMKNDIDKQIEEICPKEIISTIKDYIANNLIRDIDKKVVIALKSTPKEQLSTVLASGGIMPMYGFPTDVKPFYLSIPKVSDLKNSNNIMTRQQMLAINFFAPEAELIKDKKIYTAKGLAYYYITGYDEVQKSSNPEGQITKVSECKRCGYIELSILNNECPVCQNLLTTYTSYSPLGYYSDCSEDYTGLANYYPASFKSRLTSKVNLSSEYSSIANCKLKHSEEDLYNINDNGGKFFKFKKGINGLEGERIKADGEDKRVALLASIKTDVLIFTLEKLPSRVELDPLISEYAKVAYMSLGELAKKAAVRYLDIDSNEIVVNYRSAKLNGKGSADIFMADNLENGAGLCKYLSDPSIFSKYLLEPYRKGNEIYQLLNDNSHKCETACYNCIADYGNKFDHQYLNWRIGLDMVNLCIDYNYQITLNAEYWQSLIVNYKLLERNNNYYANDSTKNILITHPLWNRSYISTMQNSLPNVEETIDIYQYIYGRK